MLEVVQGLEKIVIAIVVILLILMAGVITTVLVIKYRKKGKYQNNNTEQRNHRKYKTEKPKARNNYKYKAKSFQTETEKRFYRKLLRATEELNVQIIPQVPLASVIEKINGKYQNELYRIIDYGVFDEKFNLLLLIELNDQTHLKKDRYIRDLKVNAICEEANIKLIRFWTNEPNEIEYISNRIRKFVEEIRLERARNSIIG